MVAMFLANCLVWSVGVRVKIWTFFLKHKNLDVVY